LTKEFFKEGKRQNPKTDRNQRREGTIGKKNSRYRNLESPRIYPWTPGGKETKIQVPLAIIAQIPTNKALREVTALLDRNVT
jgi:hypothetical protein